MSEENFAKSLIAYLEKSNLFDWFILFGFVVIVISVNNESMYVPLGGYFFVFGTLGHFISVLLQQTKMKPFIKFLIKVLILLGLCFFSLKKYPEFNPFN
jgi:hypothetical protein